MRLLSSMVIAHNWMCLDLSLYLFCAFVCASLIFFSNKNPTKIHLHDWLALPEVLLYIGVGMKTKKTPIDYTKYTHGITVCAH